MLQSNALGDFWGKEETAPKIEDGVRPELENMPFLCEGIQWTKNTNGWGVNSAVPLDALEMDCVVAKVRVKHKTKKKHNIKLVAMEGTFDRSKVKDLSSKTFKCVGYHEFKEYEAEELAVRTLVVSPPLKVKKGQFLGITGNEQLDLCSVQSGASAEVKDSMLCYGVGF